MEMLNVQKPKDYKNYLASFNQYSGAKLNGVNDVKSFIKTQQINASMALSTKDPNKIERMKTSLQSVGIGNYDLTVVSLIANAMETNMEYQKGKVM